MKHPRPLIAVALGAALVASTAALATSAIPPSSVIVGGWSEAQVDADVRKAANFALPRLKRGKVRIRSIDAVERQVVAGTNYRIDMTLSDGTRWRVVVWHRLDRTYRLTSSQRLAAAHAQLHIVGRLTYRERMALPAGSVIKVQLLDVARADAPSILLTQQRIVAKGQQVPIPFSLTIARNKLPGPIGNSVSIRIESPTGQLLWITDTVNTVEPDDKDARVDMGDLVLVKV